ncbi:MAG: type II secretion system F family protein, partial [Natronospirillum sp.]
YSGRTSEGQPVSNVIEATSMDQAMEDLKRQNIMLLSLQPTRKKPQSSNQTATWKKFFWPKITHDDLILLCRQLHALTRAGIPLMRAINGLAEASQNRRLQDILREISHSLTSGNDLATCFSRHPKVFDNLFIAMINMGETTGQLDVAFKQLIDHLELEKNTRRQIKQATRYPSFVVIALVAALGVINFMVIPSFAGVFEGLGDDMPVFTVILLNTSNFMVDYGPYLLGGALAAFAGWKRYIKTPKGRYFRDRWFLHIPLVGGTFKRVAMARFTRPFAMMLAAGVPILHALNICSKTVGNDFIGRRIEAMQAGIERGESILATASASGMFNPLIL